MIIVLTHLGGIKYLDFKDSENQIMPGLRPILKLKIVTMIIFIYFLYNGG